MKTIETLKQQSFFKDKDGHVVIWQWPNIPLYGWIIFKLLTLLITQTRLKHGFEQLSTAFLFAWALLEFTQGVNYFRRLLGLAIFIAIIVSFFN